MVYFPVRLHVVLVINSVALSAERGWESGEAMGGCI